MTDSTSPAGQKRAPKPQTGQAPAALRRRGILSCSDNCTDKPRLKLGTAIWRWYGQALQEQFLTRR